MTFVDFKSDPNIVDEDGKTALHLCHSDTTQEKSECAKLLLTKTDLEITDKFGVKAGETSQK